jgi:hypothetical protein
LVLVICDLVLSFVFHAAYATEQRRKGEYIIHVASPHFRISDLEFLWFLLFVIWCFPSCFTQRTPRGSGAKGSVLSMLPHLIFEFRIWNFFGSYDLSFGAFLRVSRSVRHGAAAQRRVYYPCCLTSSSDFGLGISLVLMICHLMLFFGFRI